MSAQPSLFAYSGGFPVGAGGIPSPGSDIYSSSIAVGDFNGDGKLDVVTANSSGRSLTLSLGDGSGRFSEAPGSPMSLLYGPRILVVADFNLDGKLDLAVSTFLGGIAILLGDGHGGFTPGPPFDPNYDAIVMAATDFNGDGKPDLAIAGESLNESIWFGDGLGGFSHAGYGSGIESPTSIAVADFNGDGVKDIAVLSGSYSSGYQIAVAGLSFLTISYTYRGQPSSLAVGDFNGDGKLDWATANNATGDVSVSLGDGAGGFTPAPGSPFIVGGKPFSIAAGDFNGDGKLDLAIDTGTSVAILLNGGLPAGSLKPQAIHFPLPFNQQFTPLPFGITAVASSCLPVIFASATPAVCSVSGETATLIGSGVCSITATQPGDATYGAADPVTDSFIISPAGQIIMFPHLNDQVLGAPALTIDATASSGLPVSFATPSPGVCTVAGNVLTIVATGLCTIVASQAGNSAYLAADSSQQSFTVMDASSHPAFFIGETALTGGVYYLRFPANANLFGYYNYQFFPILYHYDLGFEYVVSANNGEAGAYFDDFASGHWLYSSPSLFPYLYDFYLNAWLYYFPDASNPGHYTTNPRYFSNLGSGKIFTM